MALTEHAETLHRYATALQLAGFDVDVETGGGPTDLRITVPNVGWLLLASGFNREDGGWEAVLEVVMDDTRSLQEITDDEEDNKQVVDESDQTPLIDGPAKGCDSMEIVAYVRALVADLDAATSVLGQFTAAHRHLVAALAEWQGAEQESLGFLLDDGFPFSESLEDVAAKVGAYVTALAARLGRA